MPLIAIGGALGVCPAAALADSAINMPVGVTTMSAAVYHLHMGVFYVCLAIGVLVFAAMIFSIARHRRSRGVKPAAFHESSILEFFWTTIPFLILIGMAVPAAGVLIKQKNASNPDMTIKVTGYQWKWHYQYLNKGIGFFSMLAADSNRARQLGSGIDPATVKHYLRDVDHPLVLPIHKKIRILLTSGDVIHSWWVPDFGGKTDAIPGYVNSMWINITKPGIYRGQCAELCGRGHAFMPVEVVAKTEQGYKAWLKKLKAAKGVYVNPLTGKQEQTGGPVTFGQPTINLQPPAGSVHGTRSALPGNSGAAR